MSNSTVTVKQLEFVSSYAASVVSRQQLKYAVDAHAHLAAEVDGLVIRLVAHVAGEKSAEPTVVRYPADWWEAVKQRFAPVWVTKRWPVKFNEHTMRHMITYPNVPCKDLSKPYVRVAIASFRGGFDGDDDC